tara:strand:- start:689 stop:1300 length:612 start_codon:yes stop_codon:yes gene_type:complete
MYEGSNAPLTPKQQPSKTKVDRQIDREKFEELTEKDKVSFIRNAIDPELTSKQISDVLGIRSRSQAMKLPKTTIRKIDTSKNLPKGEIVKRLMDILKRQIKNKSLTEAQKNKAKNQLQKLADKYNKGKSIIDNLDLSSAAVEKELKDAGGFNIVTSGFKTGGKLSSKKKKIIKPKAIKVAKKKSSLRGVGVAKRGYGKAMRKA